MGRASPHDDRRLFELLLLSGIQSGLSWQIVLDKRKEFRAAFARFDLHKVARFNSAKVERLMANAAIVPIRRKLEAVIHNASRALAVRDEFGSFDAYLWRFVEGNPLVNRCASRAIFQTKRHFRTA